MKKKIGIILVLILTFIFGFISGTYFKSNNGNIKISKENLETSTSSNDENVKKKDTTPSPIEYTVIEANEDSVGFSQAKISLKNNGKDTLKNVEFYIIGWDIDGYPVRLNFNRDSYYKIKLESANISVGDTMERAWGTYSPSDKSVTQYEIVPYKAEFYDGTIWEDDNAEDKAKELFKEVRN